MRASIESASDTCVAMPRRTRAHESTAPRRRQSVRRFRAIVESHGQANSMAVLEGTGKGLLHQLECDLRLSTPPSEVADEMRGMAVVEHADRIGIAAKPAQCLGIGDRS